MKNHDSRLARLENQKGGFPLSDAELNARIIDVAEQIRKQEGQPWRSLCGEVIAAVQSGSGDFGALAERVAQAVRD